MKDGGEIDWECSKCSQQQVPSPKRDVSMFSPPFNSSWAQHLPDDEEPRLTASPAAASTPASPTASAPDESIEVNITFDIPDEAQESSLNESLPRDTSVPADHPTTYTIIEKGTNKLKYKLVDSDGHSYCKKRETDSGVISWNCSVCNKKVYCKALVRQEGISFNPWVISTSVPQSPMRRLQ